MAPAFPAHRGSAPAAGASFRLSTERSLDSQRPNLVCPMRASGGNNGLYALAEAGSHRGNVVFTPLLYTAGASRRILPSVRITRRFTWPSPGFSPARAPAPAPAASSGGIRTAAATTTAIPCRPCRGRHRGTNGAQGLTVDFSANSTWGAVATGAKIYATSTGAAGNSLVQVVDNGDPGTTSSTPRSWPPPARNRPCAACVSVPPRLRRPLPAHRKPTPFRSATPQLSLWLPTGQRRFLSMVFWVHTAGGGDPKHFHHQQRFLRQRGELSLVVSNLTTQTASVTNVLAVTAGAPTITPSPLPSYIETVGDHLAWAPVDNRHPAHHQLLVFLAALSFRATLPPAPTAAWRWPISNGE